MKQLLRSYILWTYGVFIIFLLIIGVTMMLLKAQLAAEILKVISAWTPTFVFFAMYKKNIKQDKLLQFVKTLFKQKIKIKTLLSLIFLQAAIWIVSLLFHSYMHNKSLGTLVITSGGTLFILFLDNVVRGPLGEELGWRGFMQNELQKKFSPLKSAIIVGVLHGFWHTPLWLLSGYNGFQLVQYIIFFMIAIISLSIIVTAFYNLCHNLFIPIIIHQLFNYFLGIQTGDLLDNLTTTAIVYLITAVVFILINYKNCLNKNRMIFNLKSYGQ